MMLLPTVALLARSPVAQPASTAINLGTQGKNADFSNFSFTRPVSVGTSLPATCQVGQLFFNQSAPAGANLYGCTSANTWTVIGGSNSGPGGQPQVSLSVSSVVFGTQNIGTTSGVKNVTLTNLGTALLTISSIQTTGTNASDFASANTCGSIVASGGSCTITITFTPSVAGAETANLTLNDSQAGSPQTIALSGTGAAPVSSGGLVITPSAAVTTSGQSITLTSNRPVNWALVSGSSGTLVVNSSTSASYTAPTSIPVQNKLAGCPVLPNDSVFNVRIDNLPLNSNSATWTTSAAPGIGLSFDTSWGTSIGDNTMPLTPETFYYTPTANGPWLIPPVPYLKRENGAYVGRANSEDH
ncbi:MAG: choice-of-anchor D domain-containing protein, partial [Acidobacteriaceae bacterium]|nr:choice-of-anchor D domain-containing protein [Acidobacteriaceae bacterium]